MPNPSLLIVVPTLNSHRLLPRLLSSLQAQTWPHWQLLFVDGPSDPEHRQWLEQCCTDEPRCRWIPQSADQPGIFGAMNQGFDAAADQPECWLLFWGSDDWAASPDVLATAIASLGQAATGPGWPDLLICRGRYVDPQGNLGRATVFQTALRLRPGSRANKNGKGYENGTDWISARRYRQALKHGSTPPHQATLIGPGARRHQNHYASGFRLSADLDYFLQLGGVPELGVQSIDLELVHMADGGVSGQQTRRRLKEVRHAYRRAFGWRWWIPFLARYGRRLASALEARR